MYAIALDFLEGTHWLTFAGHGVPCSTPTLDAAAKWEHATNAHRLREDLPDGLYAVSRVEMVGGA